MVVATALVAACAALAAPSVKPALRIDANHAVRGSHFKAHELVRVVFVTDVRQVRQVRAGTTGSFATLLPPPSDSCAKLVILAAGSSGDGAVIRLPQGLCPPPSATAQLPQPDGLPPNADGVASRNLG